MRAGGAGGAGGARATSFSTGFAHNYHSSQGLSGEIMGCDVVGGPFMVRTVIY